MAVMRVTAETKESTRQTILEVAQELFRTTGFDATTTRDIARAAGIATGTLFNYFPTKEVIVTTLVVQALAQPVRRSYSELHGSLEEALFAHVAGDLRRLKLHRTYLAPVLETALSPLAALQRDEMGQLLRTNHLEQAVALARHHRLDAALTPVALQMYWTLYLGVLAFWISDKSPRQEDTLALLDQSLEMFVGWLRGTDEKSNQPWQPAEKQG
ncbi:MAG: TetR/AcrR family transcriptional regulator [Planctomycetes bacterium]|nr:TetR/AcrR family transcriptional regulator [Planctomycetota bacterium]